MAGARPVVTPHSLPQAPGGRSHAGGPHRPLPWEGDLRSRLAIPATQAGQRDPRGSPAAAGRSGSRSGAPGFGHGSSGVPGLWSGKGGDWGGFRSGETGFRNPERRVPEWRCQGLRDLGCRSSGVEEGEALGESGAGTRRYGGRRSGMGCGGWSSGIWGLGFPGRNRRRRRWCSWAGTAPPLSPWRRLAGGGLRRLLGDGSLTSGH